MGIISSKQQHASLLAPSMEGNLTEVKRLVGIYIADDGGSESSLPSYVNSADAAGNAAIHGAVFSGHLDVLSFLVESCGADLRKKNGLGCSPLWIAAGYDRLECLQYLIDKLRESNQLESALALLGGSEDDKDKDGGANSSGDTPFLAAASKGNVNACECLLKSTEKFKCDQNENQNENDDNENEKCLEMKTKLLRTANNAGDTPLKVAVASSQGEDMLTFLLQLDDEISTKHPTPSSEEEEEDPMSRTCVNRKNKLGLSPLIIACERNLPKVAELLLKHGADIRILDAKGRNPLSIASFCGCNDTLQFLLDQPNTKSHLLNERDLNGCTPVWLAARTGNLSIFELLMDAGADATIKDNEGLTPQDVAVKFKKEKVEEYFCQKNE